MPHPDRTEIVVRVSLFPPIPIDSELTNSLIDSIATAHTEEVQAFLSSLGITTSVTVSAERLDVIDEGSLEICA